MKGFNYTGFLWRWGILDGGGGLFLIFAALTPPPPPMRNDQNFEYPGRFPFPNF
jgi:hypothetical protein